MKEKNKNVLKAVKILILCVLMLSLAIIANEISNERNTNEKVTVENGYSYKISDFDGRIAVFDAENNNIIEVFDVYLSSLPYEEQNEIKNGIFAKDRQELQRIVEDFTS